ncbi:MAG: hypothetical protein KDC44_00765 [Phaeodactylibacter sp.]|nr:hypothetical protein [Phaeodactylibacter sp.]
MNQLFLKQFLCLAGLFFAITSNAQEWVQVGADINNTSSGFGDAVALSDDGSTMIIGAPFHFDGTNYVGAAYVYRKSTTGDSWEQLGLRIAGTADADRLGYAVAISADGNTVAVSLPGVDNPTIQVGKVRVYSFDGSDWVQKGADISTSGGYEFGYDLSMSHNGDLVAVTTIGDLGGDVCYTWNGTAWEQQGQLFVEAGDFSPFSVALSGDGNRMVFGSPNLFGLVDELGSVYAFSWTGSAWSPLGQPMLGTVLYNDFGSVVSTNLTGDRIAVGIPDQTGSIGNLQGAVEVYEYNSGSDSWGQMGATLEGEDAYDYFGRALQLSSQGNTLIVGSGENDNPGGSNAGHVRIFDWDGTDWVQRGMDVDGLAFNDNSGEALSVSGDGQALAIASPGSGKVRYYEWSTTSALETVKTAGFTFGPNRTSGSFYVDLEENYRHIELSVYDMSGRLLVRQTATGRERLEVQLPTAFSGQCVVSCFGDGRFLGVMSLTKQ